jgi:2-methylcitrate dehydratase PrpD
MTAPLTITRALARFLVDARWDDLPELVRHEGKRSLLNYFAAALSGYRDAAIAPMLRVLAPLSGPRDATVIGQAARLDVLGAAFLNAAIANAEDFDDTHMPTIIHPTAAVASALLAWAEHRPIGGSDLLHALILGIDVECRVGNAVHPSHYRRGWHITATCGGFGAAAALGKLIGLDETRMVWALGNASVQACGLVENLGSMSKSIGVGNAARNGLAAALFAEQGIAGPERPIEGPRGFVAVTSDTPDPDAVVRDLGAVWEIRHNTYKPSPCGVVLFPVIDACLALRARHGLAAAAIEHISVKGHPLLLERADRPTVTVSQEARVSIQHTVAVVFLYGAAGIAQYSDACVGAPTVHALRRKVVAEADPSFPVESAQVTVRTVDGRTLTERVAHWRGSVERPLSDRDLEAKLREVAEAAPWCDAGRLIADVWAVDRLPAAATLMRHMAPPR